MEQVPVLLHQNFVATRDYLHDVAKVLGKLQQAFIAPDPHDWHYGLLPVEAGLATQELSFNGESTRAVLDLNEGCLRIGETSWPLKDYGPAELLNNLRVWLASRGAPQQIAEPEFAATAGRFDAQQAPLLGTVFRQLALYAEHLKHTRGTGLCSPVLVYPHHFDLSLSWFPFEDDKQLSFGFSTGDETITEPYLYVTAYPEPTGFTSLAVPEGAYWQTTGFSGAVLLYATLQTSSQADALLTSFAESLFDAASKLMG